MVYKSTIIFQSFFDSRAIRLEVMSYDVQFLLPLYCFFPMNNNTLVPHDFVEKATKIHAAPNRNQSACCVRFLNHRFLFFALLLFRLMAKFESNNDTNIQIRTKFSLYFFFCLLCDLWPFVSYISAVTQSWVCVCVRKKE